MVSNKTLYGAATLALILLAPGAHAETGKPFTLQDAIGSDDFKISGSIRARIENVDGQFRPTGPNSETVAGLRTNIRAEYDAGPIRFGAQLQDSREYFAKADSVIGTTEVNTLEFVQAYAALDFGDALGKGSETLLTGGRFLINLGSRRLAAENQFRNTTNGFTGVRFDWKGAKKQQLTLFYALPQTRLPSDKDDLLDNKVEWDRDDQHTRFWGGFLSVPKLIGPATAEFYLYGLDEEDSARQATRDRHLITPGIRLYTAKAPGHFDGEVEGAWQTGHTRTGTSLAAPEVEVAAWMAHAELGYTIKGPWAPRLSVIYDGASGDKAGSRSYNRFDILYGARRFDWGPTGVFGPLGRINIQSAALKAEVTPNPRWDGFVAWRASWLDSRTDTFARTSITDATGNSGDFGGHQVEARIRHWIIPKQVQLDLGGAMLFKGRFLQDAPNVRDESDVRYVYCDINFMF